MTPRPPTEKIDLPREQNHEHPQRERTGDGKLHDELREIARPEKLRVLPQREETRKSRRARSGMARLRSRAGDFIEMRCE